jgi:hypothetical protein
LGQTQAPQTQQFQASSTPASSSFNPLEYAKQIQQFNVQANQPAIQALQASKTPLEDRYKSLVDSIKGQQAQSIQSATTRVTNELGRRGILPTSGFGEREIAGAVEPLSQAYTGQISQARAAQASDISNIDKAIATLQAGSPSESVSTALSINKLQNDLTQNQIANALAQRQFEEVTLPKSKAEIAKSQRETGGDGLADLVKLIFPQNAAANTNTLGKPTNKLGPVSATSPDGKWFWDYSSNDWIPVVA